MIKKSQIPVLFILSLLSLRINGFTWLIQTLYATETCSNGAIQSALLLEMNKCYQTSDTSSTLTTCSNSGTTLTKIVYTWNNNECNDVHTGQTTYTLSNVCSNGLSFECVTDPEQEDWPGIGTWQPTVDNGAGATCAYQAGPQFVETVPTTCQTDGTTYSWLNYATSTTLEYRKYYSTSCSGTVVGSNSYPLDECFDYTSSYSTTNPVKGYAASTITAIAGTGFLTFNTISPQGNINSTTIGVGAAVGVAIGCVIMCIISCLLGYYCILHYDLSEKLTKDHDINGNDVEMNEKNGNGNQQHAPQENGIWTVLWGFATCKCCYEEFL